MAFMGVPRKPGEVIKQRAPIGEFADGSPVLLPVATITGRGDGPTLYLQAGTHGDEVTGIEIARRVIDDIKPDELSGSVVVVPVANVPSYLTRSRGFANEERLILNINSVFPGSSGGLLSERLVDRLFNEFILHADFSIDLHSALEGCDIVPFSRVDPDDDLNGTLEIRKRVAHAFGTPYVSYNTRGRPSGKNEVPSSHVFLQAEAAKKPFIQCEMGTSRHIKYEVVPIGVAGVRRALQALGALPGEPEPNPAQRIYRRPKALVHAGRGGGLRLVVSLGDDVKQGQKVAEIVDIFGETIEELTSPVDGVVWRVMKHANVSTGAEALWIGY